MPKGEIVKSNQKDKEAIAKMWEGSTSLVSKGMENIIGLLTKATPELATQVQLQLTEWESLIKEVKGISRQFLLDTVLKKGKQTTDKGTRSLVISGYIVEARPQRTGYDSKKVEALLREKDISVDQYMDKKISYVLNETRLEQAVENEELTQDELDTCKYEESWSLQAPKKVEQEQ